MPGSRRAPAGLPLGTGCAECEMFLRCLLRSLFVVLELWSSRVQGASAFFGALPVEDGKGMVGCLYPCWTHTYKTRQLCFTSFHTHRQALLRASFPLLQKALHSTDVQKRYLHRHEIVAPGSDLTGGYSAAANNGKMKWGNNAIICRNTKAIFHYSRRVAVEKITGLNATRVLQFLASCNQASVVATRH